MFDRLWKKLKLSSSGYQNFEEIVFSFLRSESEEDLRNYCLQKQLLQSEIDGLVSLQISSQTLSYAEFVKHLTTLSPETKKQLPFEINSCDSFKAKQQKSHDRLCDLVRNKRVILVGPSDYTTGRGQGDWIESFDVVVRINFQWPILDHLRVDLGHRMDLLYHCCNGDYPLNSLFCDSFAKIRFVCVEQHFVSLQLVKYCRTLNIPSLYINESIGKTSLFLKCPPSTGLVAIVHLLSLPVKELMVYGMTFWADGYYKGYQSDGALKENWKEKKLPSKIWQHNPQKERAHLRRLMKENLRLRVDEEAQRIMKII